MHIVEEPRSLKPFSLPGVGVRLRQLRKSVKKSSKNLGREAGIYHNSILVWEREMPGRTISLEKVKAIVEVFERWGVEHPHHKSKQKAHLLEYIVWGE